MNILNKTFDKIYVIGSFATQNRYNDITCINICEIYYTRLTNRLYNFLGYIKDLIK